MVWAYGFYEAKKKGAVAAFVEGRCSHNRGCHETRRTVDMSNGWLCYDDEGVDVVKD
jgi:hypothetical protein